MNFIYSKLEKDIETHFLKFLDSISFEHKLNKEQIRFSWEKFRNKEITFEDESIVVNEKIQVEAESIVVNEKNNVEAVSTNNNCCYVFIKGKNEGSSCSNIVKNGKYCTKHLKFNNSDKKDKKIIPKLVDNKKLVLIILEGTPYWWNQETSLVFLSSENKTVIAKYSNGILNKLTNSDISDCDKYKFVYDANYDFKFLKSSEDQKINIEDPKKKSLKNEESSKKKKTEVKHSPAKNNIISDEEKQKKLEIYKTNVCAKNIEDVLSNILNNSDDDYDEDDDEEIVESELMDDEEVVEENELVEEEEEEEPDDNEELDDNEEDEYLDEEM